MTEFRAKGFLPSPAHLLESTLRYAVADPPPPVVPGRIGASHRAFRGPRMFQGSANSCWAMSTARCLRMGMAIHGHVDPPIPSPLKLYIDGLRQEYAGYAREAIPSLTDIGIRPLLGVEAARKLGFVPWDRCPYQASLVTKDLDPSVYVDAIDQAGLEVVNLTREPDRIEAISHAMDSGWTTQIGLLVDKPFEENDGSVITAVNSDLLGGHMVTVLEVSENGDVGIDNWWNRWGRPDGTGTLSRDVICDPRIVKEILAFRTVPYYGGGP